MGGLASWWAGVGAGPGAGAGASAGDGDGDGAGAGGVWCVVCGVWCVVGWLLAGTRTPPLPARFAMSAQPPPASPALPASLDTSLTHTHISTQLAVQCLSC